jgi:hypothetical protein
MPQARINPWKCQDQCGFSQAGNSAAIVKFGIQPPAFAI